MAMTKIKGLQMWCRRMTDGYAHVDVANFTTAWRDGMAFCAIIHRFRPDLIDYDSLSPDNVFDNCKMAFEVAERELNIPAFLEAEDMARLKVPDKLSVITYVSQYYNFLNALPQLGGPGVKCKVSSNNTGGTKRPPDIDTSQGPSTKKPATAADGKENISAGNEKTRQGSLGDKCNICQNRVYLLERHIEDGKLYHRSCYRHSELSPTNKVYTRSPFLSPSLSKETPPRSPSPHVKTSSSNPDHQHQHQHRTPGSHHHHNTGGGGGGIGLTPSSSKPGSETAASKGSHFPFSSSVASSDSPRKSDSAGSKHSLAQPDREDPKKSKLQPIASGSEGHNSKANAIKDRLKNLKEKYEGVKKVDDPPSGHKKAVSKEKESHSQVFPLSGKESRQLEKRKEQLLSAEKRAEQSSRAGARNVPLVFQQKQPDSRSQSTSASNVLSNAKQNSTPSSSSSNFHVSAPIASSMSSSSAISSTPTSSKASVTLNTDSAQKKTARKIVKAELVSQKEDDASESQKSVEDISRLEKDESQVNKKFDIKDNEKIDIGSLQEKFSKMDETSSSASYPVAKARTHKGLDVSKDEKPVSPKPVLRKTEGSGPSTPKAAPRKSFLDMASAKTQPGQPKHPQSTGVNSHTESPPHSHRSAGSGSPPPLPSTAPPALPTSPPPSLPPSAVIKVDSLSPRNKGKSPSPESAPAESVTKSVMKNAGMEDVSTHSPVKSQVAVSSQAVASTSNKRFSSPAIHDPPLAVLVTPQVKDKEDQQVLTGLLASLAGVRGRASSVPGISALPLVPTSEKTSSPDSSSISISSSAATTASSFIPSSSSTPAPAKHLPSKTTALGRDSNKMENSGHSGSAAPKKFVSHVTKDKGKADSTATSKVSDTNRPQSGAKVPEALSVLNNLKRVGDSKPSHSTDSITNKANYSSNIEINVQNKQSNAIKKNALSASKEDLDKISTRSGSGDTKQESQERITDSNFNTVKLKHVNQSDARQNVKAISTLAFDIQLKKVEDKQEDKETKPVKISTVTPKPLEIPLGGEASKSEKDPSFKDITNKSKTDVGETPVVKVKAKNSKSLNFYEEDELPDWKTALEERKKKLRENNTKLDSSTQNVGQAKEKSTVDKATKSTIILTPSKHEKSSPISEKDTPDFKKISPREEVTTDAKTKVISVDKNSHSNQQHQGKAKSSDWKQDAEMKIAALGGFDSEEEEEKQVTKPKRVLPKVPDAVSVSQNNSKDMDEPQSKLDLKKGEKQKITPKDVSVDIKNKETPQESVPEFLTGKSKLKHVQLNEENKQILTAKKKKPAPAPPVEKKDAEDFREKLHNLKHVQGAGEFASEGEKQTPVSTGKTPKSSDQKSMSTPKLINLSKALPLVGIGKNTNTNNNKSKGVKVDAGLVKPGNKSLMDTINLTSSPDVSDEEGQNRGKNYSQQKHSTPIIENGKTSPKPKKKKIPFFGKNKKEKIESPTESPINAKKKIEAPVHIDFDKSCELDSSLPDSVSRLTIDDKRTPPQRPPQPYANHKKVTSPKHISAIELQQQLLDIDSRLTDLELRGRDLEDSIRNVSVPEEDDDSLMIQWFELVSEKNDLVRQEADLVYISREQELETDQDHIESQLRYLMSKPDEEKSEAEKEEEEYLIQRKLELVEQRNRIVDSMDEDRLRYEEEDRDIEFTLRDKGLWKDSSGTLKAIKGKRVSNSTFYT
ncbi:hypothetical protein EGW08_004514 [Elysia chlorotica]|uniref:Calponin-homology (CH) domain-containing protein n=1 Tax=Elysia chlorotica TaxID=188477 RepID=A0A433U1Z2_ELYCH|nr:hypothetical protein EGW08_004514 [Elysia chlorotica]